MRIPLEATHTYMHINATYLIGAPGFLDVPDGKWSIASLSEMVSHAVLKNVKTVTAPFPPFSVRSDITVSDGETVRGTATKALNHA